MSFPERYESASVHDEGGVDRRRLSLEEVLSAGTDALEDVLGGFAGGAVDFDALESAIDATRATLGSDLEGLDRINVDPVAHEQEGGDGISLEDLTRMLAELEIVAAASPLHLCVVHPLEEASIILHELLFRAPYVSAPLVRRLDVVLAEVPQPTRRAFVSQVIADASEIVPLERLDAVLPHIAPVLRRTLFPLADAYADLAAKATPHGREALWPHALDELFLVDNGRRSKLDEVFSSLDDEAYLRCVHRLTLLPSIAEGRLAPDAFEIDQTFFRQMFVHMLDTPAHVVIGPVVMAAFHRSPPADEGVRSLVYAVHHYQDTLRPILREQLAAPGSLVSPQSHEAITEMLLLALANLEGDQRNEVWALHAIAWLGAHDWSAATLQQFERTGEFLQRVVRERKGLRKVWSADCRDTARKALTLGGWAG